MNIARDWKHPEVLSDLADMRQQAPLGWEWLGPPACWAGY